MHSYASVIISATALTLKMYQSIFMLVVHGTDMRGKGHATMSVNTLKWSSCRFKTLGAITTSGWYRKPKHPGFRSRSYTECFQNMFHFIYLWAHFTKSKYSYWIFKYECLCEEKNELSIVFYRVRQARLLIVKLTYSWFLLPSNRLDCISPKRCFATL